MKEIPLTRGYVSIVDDEDYKRVAQYRWHATVKTRVDGTVRVYAQRSIWNTGGAQSGQKLHRLILNAPEGMSVDHINGNTLDNRKENIRLCTNAENTRNMRPHTGRSSKYKGVSWHSPSRKWQAEIRRDYKRVFLGLFVDEKEAAKAYDDAAQKYHNDFARTNFQGVGA